MWSSFTLLRCANANVNKLLSQDHNCFSILAKLSVSFDCVRLPGHPQSLSCSAEASEEGQGIILLAKAGQAGGGAVSASAVPSVGTLPSAAFTHPSERLFLRF